MEALFDLGEHFNHALLDTANDWYKQGGNILIIDEVHLSILYYYNKKDNKWTVHLLQIF